MNLLKSHNCYNIYNSLMKLIYEPYMQDFTRRVESEDNKRFMRHGKSLETLIRSEEIFYYVIIQMF